MLVEDWASVAQPGDLFRGNIFPERTAEELLRRESTNPFWEGVLHHKLVDPIDPDRSELSSSATHLYGRVNLASLLGDIEGGEPRRADRVMKMALDREVPTLTGRAKYRKIPGDVPFPKCLHRMAAAAQRDREALKESEDVLSLGPRESVQTRHWLMSRIRRMRAEFVAGPDILWFEGEIGTYRYGVCRRVRRASRERFVEETFRECRILLHPGVPLYWCNAKDLTAALRVRLGYSP